MLVLSRKIGEKINIGNDIVLTVIDIDRTKVRLGIEAPKSVSVHRHEIAEAIAKGVKIKEESSQEASDPISAR